MPLLSVQNLYYDYGLKKALEDVSFDIHAGQTTALVGPNGAGKTTLLRCITGLDTPISGTIKLFGDDLYDDPRKARRRIGYISDSFGLYGKLTVRQCLLYMARAYKLPASEQNTRVDEVIALLGLAPYEKTLARQLSRGWRQRVGIGMAIIHKPDLLILDEPGSGMDPDSRHGLSILLRTLRDQGVTCIVSSHILSELEDYCTDMLVIKNGQVLDHVHLNDAAQSRPTRMIHIRLFEGHDAHPHLLTIRSQINVVNANTVDGQTHTILAELNGGAAEQTHLLSALVAANVPVLAFHEHKQTLQNQYIDLTRKNNQARAS